MTEEKPLVLVGISPTRTPGKSYHLTMRDSSKQWFTPALPVTIEAPEVIAAIRAKLGREPNTIRVTMTIEFIT